MEMAASSPDLSNSLHQLGQESINSCAIIIVIHKKRKVLWVVAM